MYIYSAFQFYIDKALSMAVEQINYLTIPRVLFTCQLLWVAVLSSVLWGSTEFAIPKEKDQLL